MSDFNPVTLFFILSESMGAWLWLLVALAAVLLAGVVLGLRRLRRAQRSPRRPLMMAFAMGLVTAIVFSFLVPMWSLASLGALTGALDYAFAFLLALLPGAIVGSAVFFLAATRCAGMARA